MDLNKDMNTTEVKNEVKNNKYLKNIKKAIPFVRSIVGINNKEVQMQNAQVFLLSEILERLDRIANQISPVTETKEEKQAVKSKTITEINENEIQETPAEKIARVKAGKNKAK